MLDTDGARGKILCSRDWHPSKNHSSNKSTWVIAGDSLRRVRLVCDPVCQPARTRLDWHSGNSQESYIMRIWL